MKYLIIALSLIPFFALAQKVTINGKLLNYSGKDSISLHHLKSNQEQVLVTKVKIEQTGAFKIMATVAESGFYKLGLGERNFLLLVLSPNETVQLEAEASDMYSKFTVTGSPNTELFYEANRSFVKFGAQRDSMKSDYERNVQLVDIKEKSYAVNFIKKNPCSLSSLLLVDKINRDENPELFFLLDSCLTLKYPTNALVQGFHNDVQSMRQLAKGSDVPDIILKDAAGKEHKLSDLRGKVVIVDFWASWCGPCKAEVPNMRRIYSMYQEKGLEIFSVSVDKRRDDWLKESSQLPWISVHDEKGEYGQMFNIQSIPMILVIDKAGKIAAKNMRGSQLFMQIADMLDKK